MRGDLPGLRNWYRSNSGPSTNVSLLVVWSGSRGVSRLRSVWRGWLYSDILYCFAGSIGLLLLLLAETSDVVAYMTV